MRPRFQRALCLVLSTLLVLPGRARPALAQDPDPEAMARTVGKYLDAAELTARETPRDTFDLRSVLDEVGTEPEKLFAFVRDNTSWIAYAGSLRGAQGTLMDRLGNSLDRSLLLAMLLRTAGHEARLAHATLAPERAKEALAAVTHPPAQRIVRSAEAGAALDKKVADIVKQLGGDADAIQKAKEASARENAALAASVRERTTTQTKELAALLGAALPKTATPTDRGALLADHWWVQIDRDGTWTDLDPLLPGHKPGDKIAEPSDTLAFTTGKGFVLPQETLHRQRLAVHVKVLAGGETKELTVFEHELAPQNVLGTPLALHFQALDMPADDSLVAAKDPEKRLRELLALQKEWMPTLRVGESFVFQKSFTAEGEVVDKPKLDPASRLGSGLGKKLDKIGGLFDSLDAGTPETAKGELLAVHVDHVLIAPGSEPLTARRTLFDLANGKVGDTERTKRATALLTKFNLLPLCCELSPEFVFTSAAALMSANKPFVAAARKAASANDVASVKAALGKLRPVPSVLPTLALARASQGTAAGALVVDRLQLLAEEVGFVAANGGRLVGRVAFDVVANRFGVLPASEARATELAFAQGVLDTSLEAALRDRTKPTENTGELFAASAAQKIAWKQVSAADDPWLQKLDAPARAEVLSELAQGHVVVAPEKRVRQGDKQLYGWWRVDPKSGTTLGVMEGGRGQSATEYVMLMELVGFAAFVGCTGSNPMAASNAKAAGCFFCAMIAVVAAVTALEWAPAAAFGAFGGLASGPGAVISGIGCSFLGAYAS